MLGDSSTVMERASLGATRRRERAPWANHGMRLRCRRAGLLRTACGTVLDTPVGVLGPGEWASVVVPVLDPLLERGLLASTPVRSGHRPLDVIGGQGAEVVRGALVGQAGEGVQDVGDIGGHGYALTPWSPVVRGAVVHRADTSVGRRPASGRAGGELIFRRCGGRSCKQTPKPVWGPDLSVTVENGVGLLEMRRPPANYFDEHLIGLIVDAARDLDGSPDCRVLVLASEGKHFCAGAVLAWSRTEVMLLLTDWLPRKAILDAAQRTALPDVLRRWLAYALEQRGVDPTDRQAVDDAIRATERTPLTRVREPRRPARAPVGLTWPRPSRPRLLRSPVPRERNPKRRRRGTARCANRPRSAGQGP